MKNTKESGGITLVALVVTIVVLLILAGVSINLVLGNNGIIARAKETETKSAEASENDLKGMNALIDEMNNALAEKTKEESVKYKIGDFVNYTYEDSGDYTIDTKESGAEVQTVKQTKNLKWQILNIDEKSKTVDLVSENPTTSSMFFLGAVGYNNGPYIINKICEKQYSNNTLKVKARNINLLDIEKHLTEDKGIVNRNKYGDTVQYGKTKTYSDNYSYYPTLYEGQKGSGINIAENKIEEMEKVNLKKENPDPYKESVTDAILPIKNESKIQASNKVLTVTQTYYYLPINDNNYDEAWSMLNKSSRYWISARYIMTNKARATFGIRFANDGIDGNFVYNSNDTSPDICNSCSLRPVVSIPFSVLDGSKTDNAWNLNK